MPLVAMEDAQQCLQLDPSFVKAYHRLAAAHSALGRCGAYPAPPAPCAVPPCPEWRPPLGAPFASPPTPRRMPLSAVAHTRLGRSHEQRLATLTPTPTLSPPRALRPSLPGTTQVLPRYAEASAVLQRALEREEVPAEAGMREDLAEKLRQVDAQLQAQLHTGGEEDGRTEQAGRTGRVALAELLVSHGASIAAKDSDGLNVLYHCYNEGHGGLAERLVAMSARSLRK